jgi:hypothetical protein
MLLCMLQILTHMRAKLAFIECENEALQEELKQLEGALAGKRDELASLKSTRDRLWQQQRQLKESSVFVTNPMLLQDMQVRRSLCLDPMCIAPSKICCSGTFYHHTLVSRSCSNCVIGAVLVRQSICGWCLCRHKKRKETI